MLAQPEEIAMNGGRFPRRTKWGSCVVSSYRTPTKGRNASAVAHDDCTGARCRRMFARSAEARAAAKAAVASLAARNPDVQIPEGHELTLYLQALGALRPARADPQAATKQFAEVTTILGSVTSAAGMIALVDRKSLRSITAAGKIQNTGLPAPRSSSSSRTLDAMKASGVPTTVGGRAASTLAADLNPTPGATVMVARVTSPRPSADSE